LSGTLINIRKPKVWRTDMRIPIYPWLSSSGGIKMLCNHQRQTSQVWFMVCNGTFNNISAIPWRSVLLVEETGVPKEIHWPVASHWQTLSHNVVSGTPCHERGPNSQH